MACLKVGVGLGDLKVLASVKKAHSSKPLEMMEHLSTFSLKHIYFSLASTMLGSYLSNQLLVLFEHFCDATPTTCPRGTEQYIPGHITILSAITVSVT